MKLCFSRKIHGLILVGMALVSAPAFAGLDFLVSPTGQATTETCQSYALSVALALQKDRKFTIETAADLRRTEESIRRQIKKISEGSSVSHEHIMRAFEAYTNGDYKLQIKGMPYTNVGGFIGTQSGIKSISLTPPDFLLRDSIKNATLISVTRIGADRYTSGHIVAVLGSDNPSSSGLKLLILNSGIKIKDTTRNMCTEGVPDDPGRYTASVKWVAAEDMTIKQDASGMVLVWTIEKNK